MGIQEKTGTVPSIIIQASLKAPTSSPIVKVIHGTKIIAGGEPGQFYNVASIEKHIFGSSPATSAAELRSDPIQCLPVMSSNAPKKTPDMQGKTRVVVASTGDPWGCSLELAELREQIRRATGVAPSLVVKSSMVAPPGKPVVEVLCGPNTVTGGQPGKFYSIAEISPCFA